MELRWYHKVLKIVFPFEKEVQDVFLRFTVTGVKREQVEQHRDGHIALLNKYLKSWSVLAGVPTYIEYHYEIDCNIGAMFAFRKLRGHWVMTIPEEKFRNYDDRYTSDVLVITPGG